jgi:hypothetical protein
MLSLILAGLTGLHLEAGDTEVSCQLNLGGTGDRIATLSADCSAASDHRDYAALQAAADLVVSGPAMPIEREGRSMADTITLARFEGGWDLKQTTQLLAVDYTLRQSRHRPYLDCAGRAELAADGTVRQAQWACASTRRGRNVEPDARQSRHLEAEMAQGRWIVPLRYEEGCAEASLLRQHGFEDLSPELEADQQPTCRSVPYGATQLSHQPMVPLIAVTGRLNANCTADYAFDARSLIHDVQADCDLFDSPQTDIPSDSPARAVIRHAYEAAVIRGVSHMRVPPTEPSFEGRQTASRVFEFELN